LPITRLGIASWLPSWEHHRRDSKERVWQGNVPEFEKSIDPISLIRIAYAGPWAEIKYQARRRWPDASFNRTHRPFCLIADLQEIESDNDDFGAIPRVTLRTSAGSQSLPIDPNAFSYKDTRLAYDLAEGDKGLIEQLLLRTRDQLDEPAVWSAVNALAWALLGRLGKGREAIIPAATAEMIIQDVLGRTSPLDRRP
jgi:hypothetical protein